MLRGDDSVGSRAYPTFTRKRDKVFGGLHVCIRTSGAKLSDWASSIFVLCPMGNFTPT